jgi:hypothetical protein
MSVGRLLARVSALILVVFITNCANAQKNVEIARPLDGSIVREVVRILVPIDSVPEDGFITCSIDGKFQCATAAKSEDGEYYVFKWDTKASDPEQKISPAQDGRHTITVQAYDAAGRRVGNPKEITVIVANNAAKFMPSQGLKLRYNQKIGHTCRYEFKYTLNLKSVQGSTSVAGTIGQAIEGAAGKVKRSIEDAMSSGTVLVRQKLEGVLQAYHQGQAVPMVWLTTRALYDIEDSTGRVLYVMRSASPGFAIGVNLPNLPAQHVRIGDVWYQRDLIFRDVLTGSGVEANTVNTLEGLEWHNGQPCAKIKSTFSGSMKIPFSKFFTDPVEVISGETTTYFGFLVGEVVSSVTKALIRTRVPSSVVSTLTQGIVNPTIPAYTPQQPAYSTPTPDNVGGVMEYPTPSTWAPTTPMPGSTSGQDTVDVEMEVIQTLTLSK